MQQFKFSDEILATCTTQEESLFHTNPRLSWREDLTQKQKRQIVNAVKTFAKDYVFFQRHISSVNMNCDAYYKLKSLSWSKDYPDQLWAEFDIVNVHKDREGFTITYESDHDPIDPNPFLGKPVPLAQYKKTLFNLFNSISRKTLGKNVCF